MQYTAATVTAITRPTVITLGRVVQDRADRAAHPWAWPLGVIANAVHAWWLRTCRTWTVRPISTPQMLALQAASRNPIQYLLVLGAILRTVFPSRRRDRWCGDPVRLIITLPEDLRTRILRALVTLPDSAVDHSRLDEDDPLAAVRAAQRQAVRGTAVTHPRAGLSLASAALTVRHYLGDAWYYNPARWDTADGYAPFAVTWLEFAGLEAIGARRRLEIADGFALVHTKHPQQAFRALREQAFPREVH